MKQQIDFQPVFNATSKTLDFSLMPNFQFNHLMAVINITQGVIIYAAGVITKNASINGNVLTLTFDTTTHNNNDQLMVIYELDDVGFSIRGLIEKIALKALARLTFDTSGNLRVTNTPVGTQTISGSVTQGTVPWVVSEGSITQSGTSQMLSQQLMQQSFRTKVIQG